MKKKDLKCDSLEKTLLEPFGKLNTRQMTNSETELFVLIGVSNKENIDNMYVDLKKKSWSLEAMERRISMSFTVSIEKKVLIFVNLFVLGNVGQSMVYILYLQYWAKRNNKRSVTWEDFGIRIFPEGFPEEKGFRELWEAQKVEGGNMIDMLEAHKSIHF